MLKDRMPANLWFLLFCYTLLEKTAVQVEAIVVLVINQGQDASQFLVYGFEVQKDAMRTRSDSCR